MWTTRKRNPPDIAGSDLCFNIHRCSLVLLGLVAYFFVYFFLRVQQPNCSFKLCSRSLLCALSKLATLVTAGMCYSLDMNFAVLILADFLLQKMFFNFNTLQVWEKSLQIKRSRHRRHQVSNSYLNPQAIVIWVWHQKLNVKTISAQVNSVIKH